VHPQVSWGQFAILRYVSIYRCLWELAESTRAHQVIFAQLDGHWHTVHVIDKSNALSLVDLWWQNRLVGVAINLLRVDARYYRATQFTRRLDARHVLYRRVVKYALAGGIELLVQLTIQEIAVTLIVQRCLINIFVGAELDTTILMHLLLCKGLRTDVLAQLVLKCLLLFQISERHG
jgi:hypothetical protein